MLSINSKTGEVIASPYSKFQHESIALDVGTMILISQVFSWDDKIRDFIVVDGEKEDRQAYIDSFADEAGVYNILKKYATTGDVSLLNQKQGFYADLSGLPVDDLDPAKSSAAAKVAVENLVAKLGVDITSDQLASMSVEEIDSLIAKAVEAKVGKVVEKEKQIGEGE